MLMTTFHAQNTGFSFAGFPLATNANAVHERLEQNVHANRSIPRTRSGASSGGHSYSFVFCPPEFL